MCKAPTQSASPLSLKGYPVAPAPFPLQCSQSLVLVMPTDPVVSPYLDRLGINSDLAPANSLIRTCTTIAAIILLAK